jgi:hypothetical protein
MCIAPIKAFYTPSGMTFWPVSGSEEGSAPCGKCAGCRSRQAMDWSTRIWCESRLYEQNAFITLTYANAPSNTREAVEDWKCFLKALRRRIGKLRYFAVTERGDLFGRLHHHAIIFGHDFLEPAKKAALISAWSTQSGAGFVDVAACEPASINYVAGYTAKKIKAATDDDPKVRPSINPPIGYDWLRLYRDDVHRIGGIVVNGSIRPIPEMFKHRDKHGLRHVMADRKHFAKTEFQQPEAVKARTERFQFLERQRQLKSKF